MNQALYFNVVEQLPILDTVLKSNLKLSIYFINNVLLFQMLNNTNVKKSFTRSTASTSLPLCLLEVLSDSTAFRID